MSTVRERACWRVPLVVRERLSGLTPAKPRRAFLWAPIVTADEADEALDIARSIYREGAFGTPYLLHGPGGHAQ